MPAVNVAMERSLGQGFVELMVASLRPAFERRNTIPGQINDVKTAFSSWDNCMKASYCKYPAIAIIIIGALVIFSVVWCIIRCACCGLSCCCECFMCLKCCGECCGCFTPPGGRKPKHLDDPLIPRDHGYKFQDPMHATPTVPNFSPVAKFAPQYAEFDVSKKKAGDEDSLPAMPSWQGSESKKISVEEHEMDDWKKPEIGGQSRSLLGPPSAMGSAAPSPINNRSPYGLPASRGAASSSYFPPQTTGHVPYGNGQQGQTYGGEGIQGFGQHAGAYGQSSLGVDQGYHSGGYNNGGYSPSGEYGSPNQQGSPEIADGNGYDNYGQQAGSAYGMGAHPSPRPGFGPERVGSPAHSYGYGNGYSNQQRPPPQRQYTSDSTRAPPHRQLSPDVPPSPYSLPDRGSFDSGPGHRPTMPHEQTWPSASTYPGQRAYQPPQSGYPGAL